MTATATYRICEDCGHHEATRDARKCPDCMNAYLRATRPPGLRVSPWVERIREGRGVAKVFGS